jgi:hypothetical protein
LVRATVETVRGTARTHNWTVEDDIPVARSQVVRAPADDPVGRDITLAAIDLDALTYRIVEPPRYGFVEGTAPNLTYVAFAGYRGRDSFSFVADDGQETSAPATVNVFVTDVLIGPLIELPALLDGAGVLTATTLQNKAYAIVEFEVSATDTDGVTVEVDCVPASGSRFRIGDTTVSCSSTDDEGNTAVETFVVRVADGRVPRPSDPGNRRLEYQLPKVS